MAKKETYSPVKKGLDPRTEEKATQWLRLDPGDQMDVTCLVDIGDVLSTEQCAIWLNEGEGVSPVWVYTGAADPAHDLDVPRQYKAYLPLLVDGEVKVWSMGISVHKQLYDIADAAGNLRGMNLRIKRTGSGLKTRYAVTPRGTHTKVDRVEEVDVIAMLGPLTTEGVQQLIAERLDCEDYDEVLAKYKGHFKKGRGSKIKGDRKGGHVRPDSDADEEEDELEDVKLV